MYKITGGKTALAEDEELVGGIGGEGIPSGKNPLHLEAPKQAIFRICHHVFCQKKLINLVRLQIIFLTKHYDLNHVLVSI